MLFLLGISLCFTISSHAQSITLTVSEMPIGEVFAKIEKMSPYRFVYGDGDLKGTSNVSFSVREVSIEAALNLCFKDQPVQYTREGTYIMVHRKIPGAGPQPANAAVMDLTGKVTDNKGIPLSNTTIWIKGGSTGATTGENGQFVLHRVAKTASIQVSHVGYITQEIPLNGRNDLLIVLKVSITAINEVNVAYSSGYQTISRDRATGSFAQVDNALFNRSVSTDVLSRISGVTSSVLTTGQPSNIPGAASQTISVRGLSTISANQTPLIILDNFPYDGDLYNIDPNTIESITVLKDAAAASIWGVRAGNGVIVITTKKGRFNQPAKLSFNSNLTVTAKPNLFYAPTISPSDFIDLETALYQQGFYENRITSNQQQALDPVLEILLAQTNGQIGAQQATSQINALRKLDLRNDAATYLYQRNKNQQYALNISGGGPNDQYFLSGSLDNNDGNNSFLKGNAYRRVTVNGNNTYSLLKHHMELVAGLSYINSQMTDNGSGNPMMPFPYPYAQLADAGGKPLSIAQYNQAYTDTAGQGRLLDWSYQPLTEEKYADNTISESEYRINLGINYRLPAHFVAEVKYQYGDLQTDGRNLHNAQSYYTRNLVNTFTQINPASGAVTYPVPLGAILDQSNSRFIYQNFRAQLNYSHAWKTKDELNAIAGTEIRDEETQTYGYRYYGYDDTHATSAPVDLLHAYPNYITGSNATIPAGQSIGGTTNRFLSYFANASYTYNNRYTFSASGRNDGSNLFGVSTNQKHVPLWSAGGSWDISKETFYHVAALPYLKWRTTYGYQGNLSSNLSALLTTQYIANNSFGSPYSRIVNPPNPNLQWEKIGQLNTGLDFATKNNRIDGSLEYYLKNGTHLIGVSPLAPSLGLSTFQGNVAAMKGRGMDLVLNTKNITGVFQWQTNFLFSYNTEWITRYGAVPSSNSAYISGGFSPAIGKPVNALFSYRWAGLDSAGNPRGILNGKTSEDYASIAAVNDITQLKYNGDRTPRFFGSLRNTFLYKQLTLSFNITYKLDYSFRRPSVNYYSLLNGGYTYGIDYGKRWQRPGDEQHTNVPSLVYPVSSNIRDAFYDGSEILVDRGDQVRLQDIQLSYDLTNRQIAHLPVQAIRLYLYANNIGLLWRANHDGIDPDAIPNGNYSTFPTPRSIAAGVKIDW